jgi:hypothetical protein
MNTAKIFDVAPQTAATPAPAPVTPPRPDPHAVPTIGNGATADLIQKHAQGQAQAAEDERKRAAPKPPVRTPNFNREVGLIDDTFEVFVDLVSSSRTDHRFRIFGPRENSGPALPPTPTADPASAQAAYKAGGGTPPLPKSLKTDV